VNDHGDRYRSMVEPVEAGNAVDVGPTAAGPRAVLIDPVSESDDPIPGQLDLF
jgi:hypothetical protein